MSLALPRVGVIIPALNEEASLPRVLEAIPAGLVEQILVVDNGSTDRTAEVAEVHGASVIREPRRGYGVACLAGIARMREHPPDIVVFLDGDFSDHPEEIESLLVPIREAGCDLVIGSRVLGSAEPGALLPQARAGNRLAVFLLRVLYGARYTDLGPFRAVRFGRLLELGMKDRAYGWTVEMQARAALAGWKTTEVPVSYRRRIGRSKITGTMRGTVKAGIAILRTLVRLRLAASLRPESLPVRR